MKTEHAVTEHKERRKQRRASKRKTGHGIQHIMVCLDGTASADTRIAYAVSLATIFGSEITLMHVIPHHDDGNSPHKTDALGWEIARQEASARLERLEQEATLNSGRKIDIRLEQGRPAERIVALSRELGADLVVLGSPSHCDDLSWETGRTAQKVLAAARSSVLIVRGKEAFPTFVPPRRILVPLDGSHRTESVLPTAEKVAGAHGAQLVLVHVVEEPSRNAILTVPEDLELARDLATRLEAQASQYLEALRHRVSYHETLVDTQVGRQADTRQFLVELSARENIDLVILSAHGCNCTNARPFGSVTAHLLAHSRVPLLILQDIQDSGLQSDGESDHGHAEPLRGTHPQEIV